jgi:hypothetical protein
MILKRADGALGGVDSVVVGFHELVFGAGFENGRFDGFGRFIVHNVQLGLEAMLCELCVENTVGLKSLFVAAILHRLDKNRITVIIVQYEHVLVAGQGCYGESSGKVGVDNIVVFVCKANVRKYGVGLGWGLCREQVVVDVAGGRSEGFGAFGGLVDWRFFLALSRCPWAVAMDLGRWWLTAFVVRPGQVTN